MEFCKKCGRVINFKRHKCPPKWVVFEEKPDEICMEENLKYADTVYADDEEDAVETWAKMQYRSDCGWHNTFGDEGVNIWIMDPNGQITEMNIQSETTVQFYGKIVQ